GDVSFTSGAGGGRAGAAVSAAKSGMAAERTRSRDAGRKTGGGFIGVPTGFGFKVWGFGLFCRPHTGEKMRPGAVAVPGQPARRAQFVAASAHLGSRPWRWRTKKSWRRRLP